MPVCPEPGLGGMGGLLTGAVAPQGQLVSKPEALGPFGKPCGEML